MIQSEGQRIVFIDTEVDDRGLVQDAGAIDNSGRSLHCASVAQLVDFIGEGAIVAGHNIVGHDLKFLPDIKATAFIDTLYASALLFPRKPHHHLLKDEKIVNEEFNNPLSDAKKAQELFADEVNALLNLTPDLRDIYSILLADTKAFGGLFAYLGLTPPPRETLKDLIDRAFAGKICMHADVERVASLYPIETAFALSLIDAYGAPAAMPTWALRNHPHTGNVMQLLRSTPCKEGCEYCNVHNDVSLGLKRYFNFDQFRTYGGEPLQQQAAEAALRGESILVIFPTGGGKSLTFQLPALMQGDNAHGLTVVISPLQSLMKDQVDNLTDRGITKAVSINGLQDAISRAETCNMVADGTATLLYVAPEMLRSRTLQRLLMGRHVVRFVIDEAHCFSSWGQDFRVDYLHIADFVRQLSEQKCLSRPIPISCFTATAKQKVVSDICDYFRKGLGVELHVLASRTTRTNLHYTVLHVEDDNEKYTTLRNLLAGAQTPAIVYASRTHRVETLAKNLTRDGLTALA